VEDVKAKVIRQLDGLIRKDTIIATNSSVWSPLCLRTPWKTPPVFATCTFTILRWS